LLRAAAFGLAAVCTVVATHQIQDPLAFDSPLTAPLVIAAGFGIGALASRIAPA
jgi:hypothetical protein